FRGRIGLEQGDMEQFFEGLPEAFQDPFLQRLERLEPGGTGEEVRRRAGEYFRAWVAGLTVSDLERRGNVERLMRIVEVEPWLLSALRRLIEQSSLEDLRRISGGYQDGGVGPRPTLVWHLSLLTAFPEHFDDAELVLRRLALAESEPGLGNNATAVWSQLFSVTLSGTSIDFETRLRRLEEVVLGGSEGDVDLGRRALSAIFSPSEGRFVGPERIGGRYRPPEWEPRNHADLERCQRVSVDLLVRMARSGRGDLVEVARAVAAQSVRALLRGGFLEEIRAIFGGSDLPPDVVKALLQGLDGFLQLDAPRRSVMERGSDRDTYVSRVRRQFAELVPDTLHNRLLREMSLPPREDESEPGAMNALAQELAMQPAALAGELPFLSSVSARNAFRLGEALGHVDTEAHCLGVILGAAAEAKMMTFHRGYVAGLLDRHPAHAPLVNEALDVMQASSAATVVEIAVVHPRLLRAGGRALALLAQQRSSPRELFRLEAVAYQHALDDEELAGLLRALDERGALGDALAYDLGIRVIHGWLTASRQDRRARLPRRAERWAWRILEATSCAVKIQKHAWKESLKELGHLKPARAIPIAAGALTTGSHAFAPLQAAAEEVLLQLASEHPDEVMDAVGKVILDPRRGFNFYVDNYRDLIQGLPPDVVTRWLRRSGVEGARRIARHLPSPRLDDEGRPEVPELTGFVLSEFAEDERVFTEFCAGIHSFQLYGGDMAAAHEREAEVARRFLHHPLRRVRQWAKLELKKSLMEARRERALLKAG
ncbi:MAG TPA: hypothetical protein VLS89_12535, partial [Candidatus Nanopelagicales bacterium]|nr:hypothetical protein [Candidatus Nanopelagicales bacterium]